MNADGSGYVYVLFDAETNLLKIGCTKNGNRSRQRAVMSAHPSPLVNVLNARIKDRFASEAQCHQKFKHERRSGEWFSTDLVEVIEYVHRDVDWCEIDFVPLNFLAQAMILKKHHMRPGHA